MQSAQGISRDTNKVISTWTDAKQKAEPLAKCWDLCNSPPEIDPDKGLVLPHRARGHIVFEKGECLPLLSSSSLLAPLTPLTSPFSGVQVP